MQPPLAETSPLAQITELNRLFLSLLAALETTPEQPADRLSLGLDEQQRAALLALSPQCLDTLTNAPVALFRLPLSRPQPGDHAGCEAWLSVRAHHARLAFATAALSVMWHMLRSAPDWARLGFGLGARQLLWLNNVPISALPQLAVPAAEGLRVRFTRRGVFWPRVLLFAAREDCEQLRLAVAASVHLASAQQRS
ncbi:MAG: hypothetical protein JJU27_03085 [Gammaproteobacteria bacterium]|nr:hypothetical protein [Gammaproteobacteria bacterium]